MLHIFPILYLSIVYEKFAYFFINTVEFTSNYFLEISSYFVAYFLYYRCMYQRSDEVKVCQDRSKQNLIYCIPFLGQWDKRCDNSGFKVKVLDVESILKYWYQISITPMLNFLMIFNFLPPISNIRLEKTFFINVIENYIEFTLCFNDSHLTIIFICPLTIAILIWSFQAKQQFI